MSIESRKSHNLKALYFLSCAGVGFGACFAMFDLYLLRLWLAVTFIALWFLWKEDKTLPEHRLAVSLSIFFSIYCIAMIVDQWLLMSSISEGRAPKVQILNYMPGWLVLVYAVASFYVFCVRFFAGRSEPVVTEEAEEK